MGALENTVILFLSDNGASAEMMVRGDGHDPKLPPGSSGTYLSLGPGWSTLANTPFRRHKTWVHEGGISTPLVVHWPQGIAARGELRHTPGHLVDVVPTVMELVTGKSFKLERGAEAPTYPGRSLVPAFAKDSSIARESIWFRHEGNRALRAGDWKIVAAGAESPWELYNLAKDRSESRNLATESPAKLRELTERWERENAEYQKWAEKDAPPEPPVKAKKKKA
jgi:arylsulfatase